MLLNNREIIIVIVVVLSKSTNKISQNASVLRHIQVNLYHVFLCMNSDKRVKRKFLNGKHFAISAVNTWFFSGNPLDQYRHYEKFATVTTNIIYLSQKYSRFKVHFLSKLHKLCFSLPLSELRVQNFQE